VTEVDGAAHDQGRRCARWSAVVDQGPVHLDAVAARPDGGSSCSQPGTGPAERVAQRDRAAVGVEQLLVRAGDHATPANLSPPRVAKARRLVTAAAAVSGRVRGLNLEQLIATARFLGDALGSQVPALLPRAGAFPAPL
jgi:hypothetical protein